ncbi:hypothetical protein BJV78DRAFT_1285920 [Lactifluus subvellereus]|nr:hypothetical protein BJV78DRAFT_1285920 [Lactifluus subvellereus]
MLFEPGNNNKINCIGTRYAHPGPPYKKNWSDSTYCIKVLIRDIWGKRMKAKYVRFDMQAVSPHAYLTAGKGHLVYLLPLRKVLEHSEVFSHLVTLAAANTNDPFIQVEVQHYRALGLERTKVRMELAEAQRRNFDDCMDRLIEGNVYRQLYPGLEN